MNDDFPCDARRALLKGGFGAAGLGLLGGALARSAAAETAGLAGGGFQLHPVGRVEREGKVTRLRLDERYAKALVGIERFSHIWVLWWFDRNDKPERRGILQVHPRGNRKNPLTGVFACRSPVRPNLIALTLCKIRSRSGAVVEIDRIDAFDGTPILDIKPYIPSIDAPKEAPNLPDWLRHK